MKPSEHDNADVRGSRGQRTGFPDPRRVGNGPCSIDSGESSVPNTLERTHSVDDVR